MKSLLMLGAAGAAGLLAWQALRPRFDFQNKTVLITGGSRGLGLVLARQLISQGARVAIMARDAAEIVRAENELRESGGLVSATVGDLKDRDDICRFVAESRRNLGPVDVLINNAGIIGVGPMEEMREEDFQLAMQTHFWATLYTSLEVIPEMRGRGRGRIVNITSIGGKMAVPHMLPYTASKFAQVGLSWGLREELAKYGIVVTTICPGLMRTGSHVNAEFKGQHEREYAWFAAGNAMPGLSMSAETAARRILAACAHGDAEVVLSLSAKLGVVLQGMFPNLMSCLMNFVNEYVMPDPGGVGPRRIKGKHSRGALPQFVTTLSDKASERNNEMGRAPMAADLR